MKYLKKAGYFVALLVFLFLVLGPFIWTFVISITPEYVCQDDRTSSGSGYLW